MIDFKRILKGILLRPETADPADNQEGSIWHNSTDKEIKTYLDSGSRSVITNNQVQTITNKTIDADSNTVSNLAHGAEVDNPSSGVHGVVGNVVGTTDAQTLTNKTIDADSNTISNLAHGSEVDNPSSGVHGVMGDVVGTTDAQTLTNKTIDGDDNTVQDLPLSSLKTVLADAGKILQRNGSGAVVSGGSAPSGDYVGTDDVQTLTNKTINANNNTISNLEHGAEVDNPSSGVHGVTGNVVGTTDTQTLTGKTIDADNNTISNLAHGSEVDNPSSGVHGVAGSIVGTTDSQTLTNKTIDGDDNTVQDLPLTSIKTVIGDADKFLQRDGSGVPVSGKDVPTGDVVGSSDTQTLTNKTFGDSAILTEISTPSTPSSGLVKLYAKDDGSIYKKGSDGVETEVGAGGGGGSGSKNYFDPESSKFEGGTVGSWLTDDGAGNAATGLTLSATTTTAEILEGTTSLKLVKAAADHDGEFIKLASQTIDPIDRGKQLFGSFAFKPISGYVSGDLILEVYDVTNSALLYSGQEEDRELLNVTDPITFNYNAYLESTTAQIQLRLKVNNTNANTFTIVFDEFKLGPAAVLPATFERYEEIDLADDPAFTSGILAVARTGNQVSIVNKTAIVHPSGQNVATAVDFLPEWAWLPADGVAARNVSTIAASNFIAFTQVNDRGRFQIVYFTEALGGANETGGSVGLFNVSYTVPSTPYTMTANELGLQNVRANGTLAYTGTAGTATLTVDEDKQNIVASNEIIIPKDGTYVFSVRGEFTATWSSVLNNFGVAVRKDSGSGYANTKLVLSSRALIDAATVRDVAGGTDLELKKGDKLEIRPFASVSATVTGFWSISRKEDLTLIGAVKERNKVQTKILSANVTSNGAISDLTFNNLEVGRWYEVSGKIAMEANVGGANDATVSVAATHNTTTLDTCLLSVGDSTPTGSRPAVSFKFKATATTLTFVASSASATSRVLGNGGTSQTYIQIEERNDLTETDQW